MTVTDAATTDEARVNALVDQLLAELDPRQVPAKDFLGRQFDLGLAWVHHPEGLGGLGLSPKLQRLVNERVFAAGAVNPMMVNPMGYGMGTVQIVQHDGAGELRFDARPFVIMRDDAWAELVTLRHPLPAASPPGAP